MRREPCDAGSAPRRVYRSQPARRSGTARLCRLSDRLCQLGMLLALVFFLGELVLLRDEEHEGRAPAFRGRIGSPVTGLGPNNAAQPCRLVRAILQARSVLDMLSQQAVAFDKYRDAYQQFRTRTQLASDVHQQPLHRPPPSFADSAAHSDVRRPHLRRAPFQKLSSTEAEFGLFCCWLLLLPPVLASMFWMRRAIVESVVLPARYARRLAVRVNTLIEHRNGGGTLRAVPLLHREQ
jgi:hypothetical protein